jgi:ubiquinone/menaquinone biosynthesis C-methylase UbiE
VEVSLLRLVLFASLTACRGTAPTPAPEAAALEAPAPEAPAPEAHADHHGGPHQGPHEGPHGEGHFADPEQFVPSWNDPARDAWQKPEEIVRALELSPGATVVDLGAGTGYLLPFLSEAVGPEGQVLAADVEPAMLAFLEGAVADEGWVHVRPHKASFDAPQLDPASVDGIVTLNVWHHIEGREAYAAKVFEALKPGAAFVVVDFLAEPTEGFGPPLEMRLSAEQIVAELTAGGLEAEVLPETMPRHYVVRGRRPAAD